MPEISEIVMLKPYIVVHSSHVLLENCQYEVMRNKQFQVPCILFFHDSLLCSCCCQLLLWVSSSAAEFSGCNWIVQSCLLMHTDTLYCTSLHCYFPTLEALGGRLQTAAHPPIFGQNQIHRMQCNKFHQFHWDREKCLLLK